MSIKSKHFKRVETKLKKYKLTYICRMRWQRRHLKHLNYHEKIKYDLIAKSIRTKCKKLERLHAYILFQEWREKINDGS